MRLTISPWVNHAGGAIYSLDLSPSTDKLATSGQGAVGGNGLVVIWNLLPITVEKCGRDLVTNKPRLAEIKFPMGVNSVRWSRCGKMFAAASDDKTVTVWEYGGRINSAGTIGAKGKGEANQEKYRCAHTMHTHSMEVLMVDWSWDGRLLASASMDNTVVIFNARKLPEKLVVLDRSRGGHDACVKGLAFDPVGKYLATQSSDKSLRLWTTDTWTVVENVSKPFEESAQTTMYSRPDWTPDGQFLLAPGATNNTGPTAQIVKRKNWDTDIDLVGHRKAVTVVRICPRLIHYIDNKGNNRKVSCLAVGSRDKSLSIWVIPQVKRPLVVLTNIFKHSVMDAAWKDLTLICCSQDGSIKTLSFSEKELGKMLTKQEMGDVCEELYRMRPEQYADADDEGGADGVANGHNGSFIDNPEDLVAARRAELSEEAVQAEKERERRELERKAKEEKELAEKRKEQLEIRAPDGKRRIQPIFLCSTVDTTRPPSPDPNVKPPDDPTKKDEKEEKEPPKIVPVPKIVSKSVPKRPRRMEESEAEEDDYEPGAGLRKRQRTETSTESEDETGSSGEESDDESREGGRRTGPPRNDSERLLVADFVRPSLRQLDPAPITVDPGQAILNAPEHAARLMESVAGREDVMIMVHNEWAAGGGVRVARMTLEKKDVPDIQPSKSDSSKDMKICAKKQDGGYAGQLASSSSDFSLSSPQWTSFVPSVVLGIAANSKWVVTTCSDASLHVYSTATGTKTLTLQLAGPAAHTGLSGDRAYVITTQGHFYVWDVDRQSAVCARIPIADCITKANASIDAVSLAPSGAPILTAGGATFSYSVALQAWLIVDSASSLLRLCDGLPAEEIGDGVIGKMIKKRKRPGCVPTSSLETRRTAAECVVEGWVAASLALHSAPDLKGTLATYARQLVRNRNTTKLRELLSTLKDKVAEARGAKDSGPMTKALIAATEQIKTLMRADSATATLLQEIGSEGQIVF